MTKRKLSIKELKPNKIGFQSSVSIYKVKFSDKEITFKPKFSITKNITFHVARHTFATTITLMNDVPIETVSKLLGHTKLSTTQKYARVVEKKISKDMAQLKEKLGSGQSKANDNSEYPTLKIIR